MRAETFTCDNCGKVKDTEGNWWLIYNGDHISIYKWNEKFTDHLHACGQNCVIELVSKWISNR